MKGGVSEHTLKQVADFVSGSIYHNQFDLEGCMDDLRPFVKPYKNLYRVWQHYVDTVPIATIQADASSRKIMSATQDPSTISEMLDMFGNDDGDLAITKFDGEGFDPYEVIEAGLRSNPNFKSRGYASGVVKQYSYQREIVVLRVTGQMKKVRLTDKS